MSATEELRALLDARGVEHYDGCENTLWGYEQTGENTGMYRYSADEISGSFVNVWLHHLTPAQAVEATLGRGTCQDVSDSAKHADVGFMCSECGCWAIYDEYWETGIYVRAADGQPVYVYPRFCPNCGREVVE